MKKIYSILLGALLLASASCSDWLDVKPEGIVTSDELFTEGEGYRSAINGLYKSMAEKNLYGTELQFALLDCLAQQYQTESSFTFSDEAYKAAAQYNFQDPALTGKIGEIWKSAYNVVANSNNIIQSIESVSNDAFAKGEMEKKLILGEAYACRALIHFDLLRMFAPSPSNDDGGSYIPYVETYPEIRANAVPLKQALQKITDDLEKAGELVAAYDTTALGKSAIATGGARFKNQLEHGMEGASNMRAQDDFFLGRGYRLSYHAVTALLARVYQYAGEHAKAAGLAESVVEAGVKSVTGSEYFPFKNDNYDGFEYRDDFDEKTDVKTISNLIFAVYNRRGIDDNYIRNYFSASGQLADVTWMVLNTWGQSMFLNAATEEDEGQLDIRSKSLIFRLNGYLPVSGKWYPSRNEDIARENMSIYPIIRTTEMRYIMAESAARGGDFEKAYEILNGIRQNRRLWTPLPVADNYETFQRDLVRDAQREWISEGQLFYLYKRLGCNVRRNNGDDRPLTRAEGELPVPVTESL